MSLKKIGIETLMELIKFAILTTAGEKSKENGLKTKTIWMGSHIVVDMILSIQHRLGTCLDWQADFSDIGMGSPGMWLTVKKGLFGAYNLNWKTLQPIKQKIEKALWIPFFIDNDANVAALGERWMGAQKKTKDVVSMTLTVLVLVAVSSQKANCFTVEQVQGELGAITVLT